MKNSNKTLVIVFAVSMIFGVITLNSCKKGKYICTCVDANDNLSQQITMEGPEKDMEEACASKVGVGDNAKCTLVEQ